MFPTFIWIFKTIITTFPRLWNYPMLLFDLIRGTCRTSATTCTSGARYAYHPRAPEIKPVLLGLIMGNLCCYIAIFHQRLEIELISLRNIYEGHHDIVLNFCDLASFTSFISYIFKIYQS